MAPLTPPAPGASAYGVTPNNAPVSRQAVIRQITALAKDEKSVDVATLGGFTFEIDIQKPTPAPSPSPKASSKPHATPKPTPSPSPSPSPTPTHGTWKGDPTPTPTPSGPRISAEITIYPDGTQKPPGDNGDEDSRRVPIFKAVFEPTIDLALYSLGAFKITIPAGEMKEDRGFTVALYETRKHREDHLIDSQLDARADDNDVVRATNSKDAHTLSKGHTYTVLLFGDPLPQTPSPYSPPNYPGQQMHYSPQIPPPTPLPWGQSPYAPQTPQPMQPPGQPFPPPPGFPTPTPIPTPWHY